MALRSENGKGELYIAGPLGFAAPGYSWYQQVLIPGLRANGWTCLDPWDPDGIPGLARSWNAAAALDSLLAAREAFEEINEQIGTRNEILIQRCAAVLAWVDGVDVDSGTAAEIGYACAIGKPIVAIRTDLRQVGDNAGAVVNLQVEYFVRRSGGRLVVIARGDQGEQDPWNPEMIVREIAKSLDEVRGRPTESGGLLEWPQD